MTINLLLTSDIPPSVNHYLGNRTVVKNGKAFSVSYTTQESKRYKKQFTEYVKQQVKEQGWNHPLDKYQHFYVDAVFFFDKVCRDCNNYFKVMLDAITDSECVWVDDNVVCERVQRIYYDSENPRIELNIHPVEYIGLFDTKSQLDNFISNCIGCTRYSRNCSILNKARVGKIQPDIIDNQCQKFKPKRV